MSDEKQNPALNMTLPNIKNEFAEVVNGKVIQKYTPVYILTSVFCSGCGNMITPSGVAWFIYPQELQSAGENVHSQGVAKSHVICANPKLLIAYSNGFILSELWQNV